MRVGLTWPPERLAERYLSGVALRSLATESGLSYGTVHLRLQQAGVTMRPVGGHNRPPRVVKSGG